MHFNENAGRAQAVTKTGELQWTVSFPKSRHGEGVAKEVKSDQTYGMLYNRSLLLKSFKLFSFWCQLYLASPCNKDFVALVYHTRFDPHRRHHVVSLCKIH